jgi:glycine cleavage system H lipoate-binding protein
MKKEGYGPLLAIAEATMQHFDITEEQLKTVNHKRAYEKRVFVWVCVEVYKVPMTKMGEYLHKTVVSLQSVLKTVRSSMDIDRNTTEYMKDIEAIKSLVNGEKKEINLPAVTSIQEAEAILKKIHLSDSDQTSFPISGVLPPASSTEKVCIQISWEMADYPDLMTGLEEAALVDIRSIEHEALYLIVKGLKARQEKSQS